MKLFATTASLLLAIPVACWSQETENEFNVLVDEVLELTGALSIGEQMANLIVAQMVDALRATQTTLPDRALALIEEEVNAVLSESMESGEFQDLMYPIYARYLTKADLEAMVAFYRTPEGQRIVEVLPVMSQEGMVAGQKWGESLGPEIGRRVLDRLSEEGIELE